MKVKPKPGTPRDRYARYAAKRERPMPYRTWLFFHEQGKRTTSNHSEAGKAGMAKRWGKRPPLQTIENKQPVKARARSDDY